MAQLPDNAFGAYIGVRNANQRAGFEEGMGIASLLLKQQAMEQASADRREAIDATREARKATLVAATEARQDRLMQFREGLELRKQQMTQAHEATLQRLTDQQERAQAAAEFRAAQLNLQKQQMQVNQELQRLRIDAIANEKERKIEKENLLKTQQLGAAFEKAGLHQMDTVLSAAEKAVADDSVLEYLNGPKSALPDMVLSKKMTDARQDIVRLFNITLKDRSGAAVTNPELDRLKEEFGRGVFRKPEQLRSAVQRAREIVENHYRGIAAGFGSDALDLYNKNMQEIGGNPVLAPRAAGASGAAPAGVDPKIWAVMTPQEKALWQK